MKALVKTALAAATVVLAAQAGAQVVFYDRPGFEGQSFQTERQVNNLNRFGFNDRASSAVVVRDTWEVCDNVRFSGRCMVLRPGSYPNLAAMGLGDRISSARIVSGRIADSRWAPPPPLPVYDNRPRRGEELFQVNVSNVRAVVGPPEQRCWVEREQVVQQQRSQPNVGGAIIGGLLGGVIGHQVGGGSGKDLATAAGVVGGAAIGGNVNRGAGGQVLSTQDVQKCTTVQSSAPPEFWEVTYNFRGQEHRVQMTQPPGPTIQVNAAGEPRA